MNLDTTKLESLKNKLDVVNKRILKCKSQITRKEYELKRLNKFLNQGE